MAVTVIAVGDARVDQRISIGPGGTVELGACLARETTPLDAHTVALVLQSVDGGADVEATFETDFTVGLVAAPNMRLSVRASAIRCRNTEVTYSRVFFSDPVRGRCPSARHEVTPHVDRLVAVRKGPLGIGDQVDQRAGQSAKPDSGLSDRVGQILERVLLRTPTQSHQDPDRDIDHPPRRQILAPALLTFPSHPVPPCLLELPAFSAE
jgi:hypothetical protein